MEQHKAPVGTDIVDKIAIAEKNFIRIDGARPITIDDNYDSSVGITGRNVKDRLAAVVSQRDPNC
jgi:hypothetical protein